mmetsp:Transcript_11769/g.21429  ORF Transcript_11769/g.21429 Transcript_11769/m.21429 type:complete len:101 (-) Transcript_11769:65-367(-)
MSLWFGADSDGFLIDSRLFNRDDKASSFDGSEGLSDNLNAVLLVRTGCCDTPEGANATTEGAKKIKATTALAGTAIVHHLITLSSSPNHTVVASLSSQQR